MKIQNYIPPQAPKTLKANQPKDTPAQESFTRSDRAFQATSKTAKNLTSFNVATGLGVSLGITSGSLVQAATASAPLAIVVGGALGVAAAYGGYQVGSSMSDWAGKIGRRLDKNQPERGEALARGLMTAATGITFIESSGVTGLQMGVLALNGGLTYALDDK